MDGRRSLPSVDRVVGAIAPEFPGLPHELLVIAARESIDAARERDAVVDLLELISAARDRAAMRIQSLLRPLINATGVMLHTNLGRAPLGPEARAAAAEIGGSYSNLELNLADGQRGSRHAHAGSLLAAACGAEAGLVVNNGAAAVLLVLRALARDRQVVVSRGELVEIGGGFRVPDVMAESGAHLVEVGTTNRTRRADYELAIGPESALLLKVHTSNYRMVGFVESTGIGELASLGPPVVLDAGSGLLDEATPWLARRPTWLRGEPGVRQSIEAGAALVTFSGDKLLGGPQAGVIVGRADLVAAIARCPLARAVRADKVTLAALQAVALAYLRRDGMAIPLWRMATAPLEELRARADAIARTVDGAKTIDTEAVAGAGSLPGLTIPSIGVAVAVADPAGAIDHLRVDGGVVARVSDGSVVCDLRTVDPADDERLSAALRAAC